MKRHLTFIYFLQLIVSLALIVGDCSVHNNTFSKNLNPTQKECPNQANHLADSNMGSFEDEEVATASKAKIYKLFPLLGLIPSLDASFKSHFTTVIWQPPRL